MIKEDVYYLIADVFGNERDCAGFRAVRGAGWKTAIGRDGMR